MAVEQHNGIAHDVPEHEAGETSSIGGLWPAERASHRRTKAFYDRVIAGDEVFEPFMTAFDASVSEMQDTDISRVQYRAVFERSYLDERMQDGFFAARVEAIVPLDPGDLGENPVVAYVSANADSRRTHPDDQIVIAQNIEAVAGVVVRHPLQVLERAADNGYAIEILSIPSDFGGQRRVLTQMSALYERFGWSRNDVADLLRSPNNIIAVARKDGAIVSAGIAELAAVPVNGRLLRMAEITEAATLSEHEGNGAYAAISTRLLIELANRTMVGDVLGGRVDLVFGECNANERGVLKIARTQGRLFCGILRQQVPIKGAPVRSEYNDLVPTSLTRRQLLDMFMYVL